MSQNFHSDSWYRIAALRPQLHPRLIIGRHAYRGSVWYVMNDPESLENFRVTRAAFMILGRMDGATSIAELWDHAVAVEGDDAPAQDDLISLLGQLHQNGLLLGDVPPETEDVFERRRKRDRKLLKSNLMSPMSFRVPLWDPDRFLTQTMRFVRPLFRPLMAVLWGLTLLYALIVLGQNWDGLSANIVDRVLSFDNLLVLLFVYPIVKAVHELAHGYAIKARGGAVHEMGIMFLVFFPVPYVDASSATADPSKTARAGVALAGIGAELFLASIALIVWDAMQPGLPRAIMYNVILIGGISTLLVNGNPLLKFDGYYALCDLIEMPNLADRANKYLGETVRRHVFGAEIAQPAIVTGFEKYILLFYAPAAFLYRLVVLVGIGLFVAQKYFIVGVGLAIWSLTTGLARPIAKGLYQVFAGANLRRHRGRAIGWTIGAIVAATLFLFFVPMPFGTSWQGIVWLPDDAQVRTGVDGFVDEVTITHGDVVHEGMVVARLSDPFFAATLAQAWWRVAELKSSLAQARLEDSASYKIAAQELARAEASLMNLQEKAGRMTLKSGQAGKFVAAVAPDDLAGRFLSQGSVIGYVLPDQADRVRVVVGQADVGLVRDALSSITIIRADRLEDAYETHLIGEVPGGGHDLPSAALSTLAGGQIATDPMGANAGAGQDADQTRALARVFAFDVALPDQMRDARFGGRVYVKFSYQARPIGLQIWRQVRLTFLSQFDV